MDHLPKSMIILGAGPIAMEMAQSFSRLGTQVVVIQRSGQILSKEDKDMADEVMNVLSSEGRRISFKYIHNPYHRQGIRERSSDQRMKMGKKKT